MYDIYFLSDNRKTKISKNDALRKICLQPLGIYAFHVLGKVRVIHELLKYGSK